MTRRQDPPIGRPDLMTTLAIFLDRAGQARLSRDARTGRYVITAPIEGRSGWIQTTGSTLPEALDAAMALTLA
jgi:hypothetical protein